LFSNFPLHYAEDSDLPPKGNVVGLLGKNPRIKVMHPEAILAIHDAALKSGNIPNTFEEMQ
jgi:hypothetical protein